MKSQAAVPDRNLRLLRLSNPALKNRDAVLDHSLRRNRNRNRKCSIQGLLIKFTAWRLLLFLLKSEAIQIFITLVLLLDVLPMTTAWFETQIYSP
jgi:hypothetical protein